MTSSNHSLTLALSRSRTLSLSHSLTLSLSHPLTLSLPHSRALSHVCTLALSHSLTLALSHSHTLALRTLSLYQVFDWDFLGSNDFLGTLSLDVQDIPEPPLLEGLFTPPARPGSYRGLPEIGPLVVQSGGWR